MGTGRSVCNACGYQLGYFSYDRNAPTVYGRCGRCGGLLTTDMEASPERRKPAEIIDLAIARERRRERQPIRAS